jgi:enamine deaminase RidA (YjgF/YER057c/UK114 family)
MSKQVVATTQAPGAAGPYSQGIVANGFMFVAGQIGVVPGTKDFVAGGIKEQTAQVLNNLKAIWKRVAAAWIRSSRRRCS